MKGFFSIDSKFIEFMNTLVDVFILNVCFLIGCIPLVTIGTSITAACSVGLKIYEGRENHVWKQFFLSYKENLKHGIPITLVTAVITYALWLDMQLFNNLENSPIYFLIIFMIVGFFTVVNLIYIFPLESRYDNSLYQTLQNARKIAVRYWPRTLLMLVLLTVEVFLFYGVNDVLFVVGLCIGPMTMIMTVCGVVLPVFEELEREQRAGEDGEEHNVSPIA